MKNQKRKERGKGKKYSANETGQHKAVWIIRGDTVRRRGIGSGLINKEQGAFSLYNHLR